MLALSGALMPGPVLTVTVSESTHRGSVAGPLMILGHGLLELLLIILLLAGLAPFIARDEVFIAVSLVGGTILLWMAWSMVRELPTLQLQPAKGTEEKRRSLILAGVLLSLANPYWLIWWATVGIGYILYATKYGLLGVATFFAGHILADLAWYTFVSFGVSKGKRFFDDTIYRRLICACAGFLALFSCYFFYSGIGKGYALLNMQLKIFN